MTHLKLKTIANSLRRIQYRGVFCMKFPFDLVLYQMIIHEVRPDLIIEIGTLYGGSALYFADLMTTMGIDGEVHTIDIEVPKEEENIRTPNVEVGQLALDHPKIKFFKEGYEKYDLKNIEGFKTILVIDDGSHIYKDVKGALDKFAGIVTPGSYYIVEDGNAEETCSPYVWGTLEGGPLRAIYEFVSSGKYPYYIDLHKCDFFGIDSTYNTYGYLKKAR